MTTTFCLFVCSVVIEGGIPVSREKAAARNG